MKRALVLLGMVGLVLGLSCATSTEGRTPAPVTQDLRRVEQDVRKVFDYIEGKTDERPVIQPEKSKSSTSALLRLVNALDPMSCAYAEEDAVPALDTAIEGMRQHNPEVTAWKERGCLGENNRGYLELRDCGELSEPEKKNRVQKLLADENKDRKVFYREFARLKNVTVTVMEGVGAKDKLSRSGQGASVQLPLAGKDFDAFKASAAGKKLGSACAPGAWVVIP